MNFTDFSKFHHILPPGEHLKIDTFFIQLNTFSDVSNSMFSDCVPKEDPRILGLAMIPGKHVISIEIDETSGQQEGIFLT